MATSAISKTSRQGARISLAFALATTIILPLIAAGLAVMIPTRPPGQKT